MAEKIATREAYGKALAELGRINDKVIAFDADLSGSTMSKFFRAEFPDRFFEAGIAEANMISMAAGASTMGLIPFCSSFAMFATGRAYEQIRNSVGYPGFNVKICGSHAGLSVGEDGATHQCLEDVALMRLIPGMTVIAPADAKEARKAVFAIAEHEGPVYIRTARLATPVLEEDYPFEIGKANLLTKGPDAVVFAYGLMVAEVLEAYKILKAQGIDITIVNMHTIKPIDRECVLREAARCKKVFTLEEATTIGGIGDAVSDVLLGNVACKFRKIGVHDEFGRSGKALDVLRAFGLQSDLIAEEIMANL
ncbi:MAG: transketolase C-terminal domain-containing protein [Eubacteriales bacterium]|nr:transketolase C-terminal domain-containing protein [Eubacteriales bacterium]